jgi:hypothetical protein
VDVPVAVAEDEEVVSGFAEGGVDTDESAPALDCAGSELAGGFVPQPMPRNPEMHTKRAIPRDERSIGRACAQRPVSVNVLSKALQRGAGQR